MHHIQASLKRRLVAPWIAARADGYPTPTHLLPLPRLYRRGESSSNALGYGGIAVAVIGVVIAALGIFWKFRKNLRRSKQRVRVFRAHFLWWRWRWLCANGGHKIRTHSQAPSRISSPPEILPAILRPLDRTGGDRRSDLVVTVELHVQPAQAPLPRPQLPPPARSRSPLQLQPLPPTRSWTLPTMASDSIARPSPALSRASISRAAHE